MTRRCVLVFLVGLAACRGANQSVAPDGRDFPHVASTFDRHAPSMEALSEATYTDVNGRTVTLTRGAGRASGPEAATVTLVKGFRVTGDLTGNGRDEAVVLLEATRPNAPLRTYLVVAGWIGGHLMNIATTVVPDDVVLRAGRIEPRRIVLEGVRRDAAGAAVGAPEAVHLTYALEGTTLRLVADPR